MRRTCRCGHPRKFHLHYRAGTECSQCGCPWFLWQRNPFLIRVWRLTWRDETVHRCPLIGAAYTPCCGRTPFELPRDDRLTDDPADVTCPGGS